jgi:tocopherol O-methyltransferase
MKISTSQSIVKDRSKLMKKVVRFWDDLSAPIDELRGHHLHHGYFEDNAKPTIFEAQEFLLTKLATFAEIQPKEFVLDVGCGLGSTALFLAQQFAAKVEGVTISPNQVTLAQQKLAEAKVVAVDFRVDDALKLETCLNNTFDTVWCLDSCSQFIDKPLFFRQAYRVLKPGGKLMLAAWCSSQDEYRDRNAWEYLKLCRAFNIPYLPSINAYIIMLQTAGFNVGKQEDWSDKVAKTWEKSYQVLSMSLIKRLFLLLLKGGLQFFQIFESQKLMQKAYLEKRMRYGVFLASKPIKV